MASIEAAGIIAKHLSETLNQKISILDVHDEMFLIECGMSGKNKELSQMVGLIMRDNMKPANETSKKKLQKRLK